MYHRYFGLEEVPFSIAVDPRYLYMSARHRDALAHLLYGVSGNGGFVLLSGEVGTGKTTIIRALLEQLPDTTDIAMVFNPAISGQELLETICEELNVSYLQDRLTSKILTKCLYQYLLQNHAQGRNTVLLIDEAQHLTVEALEQVRLLTNLETNTKKLLQIILVGQPEIRKLINRQELSQLSQRITARYHLKPLNLEETNNYIRHRLEVAGLPATQALFPSAIIKNIYTASGGVPRIINVLCDHMLLGAYGQNKTEVDEGIFNQAVIEVFGEDAEANKKQEAPFYFSPVKQLFSSHKPLYASMAAGLVILVGTIFWQLLPNNSTEQASLEEHAQAITTKDELTTVLVQNAEPEPNTGSVLTQDSTSLPIQTGEHDLSESDLPASIAVPTLAQLDSIWIAEERAAVAQLLSAIGVNREEASDCELESFTRSVRCEHIEVDSWQELKTFNRPAVLKLITRAKMQRYLPLLGFNQNEAFVLDDGELIRVSILELGEQWNGEASFFWRVDEQYKNPIAYGDRGPVVSWVAQQFALYDQQEAALAEDYFNEALLQRVIIFQRDNQLQDDGVVGIKTLLKLEEKLGDPVTLLQSWPEKPVESVSKQVNLESAPLAKLDNEELVNKSKGGE